MKSSFNKILFVVPLLFIGTLFSYPPASSGRADLRQVFALGLKGQLNEARFIQNTEPLFTLEVLKQTALNATSNSPRIAIVGAGIAGLTAAYRLNQLGYSSYMYEGSERCGGRILSAQFPNGQIYEKGAELISATDLDLIALVNDLNLTLYEQFPGNYPLGAAPFTEVVEYQDPAPAPRSRRGNRQLNRQCLYGNKEIVNDWYNRINPNTGLTIYEQMYNDAITSYPLGNPGATTPWPIIFPNPTFTAHLDSMNLNEYIDSLCSFLRLDGVGSKSKLAQYFKARMTANNGADSINQTPLLDFIWEITLGASGNSYHIKGGNSQVIEAMVKYLRHSNIETPIFTNYRLIKIKQRTDLPPIDTYGNFPYELTFETPAGIVTPPPFDHIILTNPFSTYRKSDNPYYFGFWIDISEAGFSDLKKYAIQNLPMGINSKLNIQFKNRFWRNLGNNGFNLATSNPSVSLIPEKLYQSTWEASSGQPGKKGILIDLRGGEHAIPILNSDSIANVSNRNQYLKNVTRNYLYQLSVNLPGAVSSKNFKFKKGKNRFSSNKDGKVILNVDTANRFYIPWTRGSYPYTSLNQIAGGTGLLINGVVIPEGAVVSFWGFCGVPEPYTTNQTGNCHFAGDGTTYNQIGYMNAAVISASRVVTEVLNDL